ncbi:hypothetical protein VTN00DRAFT_2202 [Thermoascus crustaceus]|uniref:uncharacterized protein n=1 Tax=Thermoascus crustaceus TaxID=5088 RepID=UPI0037443FB6
MPRSSPRVIYHTLNQHPGLSPVPDPSDAQTITQQRDNELVYRQLLAQSALAVLLPTEDLENICLRTLVGDILADLILGNEVSGRACEGWFVWGTITRLIAALKHRDTDEKNSEETGSVQQSRLERFGLLSTKEELDYNHSSSRDQSQTSIWIWTILQGVYLTYVSLRFVVTGLFRVASTLPATPSRAFASASSNPISHANEAPSSGSAKRPVLDYRVYGMLSQLVNVPRRMPWLGGTLSLLQYLVVAGPGRLGDTGGILDSPFSLKTTCGPNWRSGAAEYSVVYATGIFDRASEGFYWRNYSNRVEDKTRRGLSARILLRSLDLVVAADGPICGDTAASAAYRAPFIVHARFCFTITVGNLGRTSRYAAYGWNTTALRDAPVGQSPVGGGARSCRRAPYPALVLVVTRAVPFLHETIKNYVLTPTFLPTLLVAIRTALFPSNARPTPLLNVNANNQVPPPSAPDSSTRQIPTPGGAAEGGASIHLVSNSSNGSRGAPLLSSASSDSASSPFPEVQQQQRPSEAEIAAMKRQCAASILSLIPRRVALMFFGVSKDVITTASAAKRHEGQKKKRGQSPVADNEGGGGDEAQSNHSRGPSPSPTPSTLEEAVEESLLLSAIETEILDLFADEYCNRHLVYAIIETVLVRLLPELSERSVAELMDDRGVIPRQNE